MLQPKTDQFRAFGFRILAYAVSFLFVISANSNFSFAEDKIIAVVNNDIITARDLNDFVNFIRIQLATQYSGKELENKIQSMKPDLLNKLIEDRLILFQAKQKKIKVDENRIKDRISEMKRRYNSDSEFQYVLTRQGLTQADIEARIREQLLMFTIIDAEIRSKIVINPTEVTDFFQKNMEKFKIPEQREVTALATDSENQANEIYGKLRIKCNLENIASSFSLMSNKIIIRQDEDFRQEIKNAVFRLNLGEVSRPIKINNKFYIFRLDSVIMPRQQNLSECQDKIYTLLFEKKIQERLSKWLGELRKQAYIKISKD